MAEIRPLEIISSMSGKVCQHSDMHFRTNKQTGKVTTGKLCNPSTKEPSSDQIAQRALFATQSKNISAYLKANKAVPTDDYKAIVAAYRAQHTIGSLRGYMMKHYEKYQAIVEA